jgi:uncharacterized protein YwgA
LNHYTEEVLVKVELSERLKKEIFMNINDYKKYTNINLSNTSQLKLFNILKDITENEHYLNIFRSYILNVSQLNDSSFYDLYEVPNNTFLENIAFEKYSLPNL